MLEYTFRAPFQLFRAAEVWPSLRSTCGSLHWELFPDIALTNPLRGSSLMECNTNRTSSGHIRVCRRTHGRPYAEQTTCNGVFNRRQARRLLHPADIDDNISTSVQ